MEMTECEKCKIWDMAAKEAGAVSAMCSDCFDRNHTIFKSEYTPIYQEFGCSIPIRFQTSDGIKTMQPGKSYDEDLNER